MRANCEKALSTDRHIFWKSLADMPGIGLPEGPADQEPTPGASGAGFAPWGRPLRIPVGAVPPGAPLLLLEIFGHLVDVLGAGLLRPGLLRPGLLRLALGSPPAVVRPSTARSRTLRIHGTTPNAPAQPADRIKAAEPRISCFPVILPRRFQPPAQPHGMRTTFKFPKHEERPTGNNIRTPAAACGTRYIPKRPSRLTNKGGSARDLEL